MNQIGLLLKEGDGGNQMKNVRSLVVVGVLSGVLAVGIAAAQERGNDGGRRGFGRAGAIGRDGGLPLRALSLTDAQRQQIRTLTAQHREQNRPGAERLRAAADAHRKAVEAFPFDEQAIRTTSQALADAQADMAIAQARLRTDIFALLTPEQQAQVTKLRAERDARRSERSERSQPRQQTEGLTTTPATGGLQ